MEPIYIVFSYQPVSFQKLFKILQNGALVTIALFLTHPVYNTHINSMTPTLAKNVCKTVFRPRFGPRDPLKSLKFDHLILLLKRCVIPVSPFINIIMHN